MRTHTVLTTAPASGALLLALGLAGLAPVAAAADRVVADRFRAKYPDACEGAAVTTGLCLLGATRPAARGDFLVSIPTVGPAAADDIPVPLNTNVALAPGQYQLYQQSGLDRFHPYRLRVVEGEITTIETATVLFQNRPGRWIKQPYQQSGLDRFHPYRLRVGEGEITTIETATVKFHNRPGRWIKLQHWQAKTGVDGAGCEAEIGKTGVHALLPGLYQATLVPLPTEAAPTCEQAGVAFFASAGEGVRLRTGAQIDNELPAGNRYRHSTDAIALATMGPARHGVREIGLLPVFRSYRGVHFPGSAKVGGLVLTAPPGSVLVVPLKVGAGSDCGVSLSYGGIPARVLLADCRFDADGDLTGFTVNAGTFFALDNLSHKSGMAGHAINSPIVVRNVKFDLGGN